MPEQLTFTTAAFGGFEKKQVLDYVYKMHEEMDRDRDNHKKKLNEISIAFKELEARAVSAEQRQETLNNRLSESKQNLETERQSKEQYKLLNKELKLKLDQYERIIEQRKQQDEANLNLNISAINDVAPMTPIAPLTPPRPVEREIDPGQTAQIGRVMLDAHSKANNIIKDAKIEAEKILNDAKFSIEEIRKTHEYNIEQYRKKAEIDANQLINLANQRIYDSMLKAYTYAKSMMDDISAATNTAASNFLTINENVIALNNSTQQIKNSLNSTFIESRSIPTLNITIPSVETSSSKKTTYTSEYDRLFNSEDDLSSQPRTPRVEAFSPPDYNDSSSYPTPETPSENPFSENLDILDINYSHGQVEGVSKNQENAVKPVSFPSLDPPNSEYFSVKQ